MSAPAGYIANPNPEYARGPCKEWGTTSIALEAIYWNGITTYNASAVSDNGDGTLTITLVQAVGFGGGDVVEFIGFTYTPDLNGSQTVLDVTGEFTFTITGTLSGSGANGEVLTFDPEEGVRELTYSTTEYFHFFEQPSSHFLIEWQCLIDHSSREEDEDAAIGAAFLWKLQYVDYLGLPFGPEEIIHVRFTASEPPIGVTKTIDEDGQVAYQGDPGASMEVSVVLELDLSDVPSRWEAKPCAIRFEMNAGVSASGDHFIEGTMSVSGGFTNGPPQCPPATVNVTS